MGIRVDAVTVVYLDMYFLTNFILDFFLSVFICTVMNWRSGLGKKILTALSGAVWSGIFLWSAVETGFYSDQGAGTAFQWMSAVVGAWFMIFLLGGRRRPFRERMKAMVFLFLGSAGFAGIIQMFGLEKIYVAEGTEQGSVIPAVVLYLGILTYCWLVSALIRRMRVQQRMEASIVTVDLVVQGKHWHLKALVDTGNNLYDPYGHRPIHIVEARAAEGIGKLTKSPWIYVPYQSLGQTGKVIPVTVAEQMYIFLKDKTIYLEQQCVGVTDLTLNSHGYYHMLLHPDFMIESAGRDNGKEINRKNGDRKEIVHGDQSECTRQDSA